MTNDIITQLLLPILACLCDCLNATSSCHCPCRNFISAGPPVWDMEACCGEGQLTLHVDRFFQHGNFPSEDTQVNLCQSPLAVDVVATLLRCFPSVHDDGSAPTADEIGRASEAIYQDLYTMTRCLICNLSSRGRYQKSVFRGSRILSPQGGCVGGEIRFTIELPDPLPF